jgi:hypothetical protein
MLSEARETDCTGIPGSLHPAGGFSSGGGDEAKSYFTVEDKIIIAKQRPGPAGT